MSLKGSAMLSRFRDKHRSYSGAIPSETSEATSPRSSRPVTAVHTWKDYKNLDIHKIIEDAVIQAFSSDAFKLAVASQVDIPFTKQGEKLNQLRVTSLNTESTITSRLDDTESTFGNRLNDVSEVLKQVGDHVASLEIVDHRSQIDELLMGQKQTYDHVTSIQIPDHGSHIEELLRGQKLVLDNMKSFDKRLDSLESVFREFDSRMTGLEDEMVNAKDEVVNADLRSAIRFGEISNELHERNTTLGDRFWEMERDLGKKMDSNTRRVTLACEELSKGMRTTQDKISSLEMAQELKAGEDLVATSSLDEKIESVAKAVSKLASAENSLRRDMSSIREKIGNLDLSPFDTLARKIESLERAVLAVKKELEGQANLASLDSKLLSTNTARLETIISATGRVEREVESVKEQVYDESTLESIEGTVASMNEIMEAIRKHISTLDTSQLSSHSEKLDGLSAGMTRLEGNVALLDTTPLFAHTLALGELTSSLSEMSNSFSNDFSSQANSLEVINEKLFSLPDSTKVESITESFEKTQRTTGEAISKSLESIMQTTTSTQDALSAHAKSVDGKFDAVVTSYASTHKTTRETLSATLDLILEAGSSHQSAISVHSTTLGNKLESFSTLFNATHDSTRQALSTTLDTILETTTSHQSALSTHSKTLEDKLDAISSAFESTQTTTADKISRELSLIQESSSLHHSALSSHSSALDQKFVLISSAFETAQKTSTESFSAILNSILETTSSTNEALSSHAKVVEEKLGSISTTTEATLLETKYSHTGTLSSILEQTSLIHEVHSTHATKLEDQFKVISVGCEATQMSTRDSLAVTLGSIHEITKATQAAISLNTKTLDVTSDALISFQKDTVGSLEPITCGVQAITERVSSGNASIASLSERLKDLASNFESHRNALAEFQQQSATTLGPVASGLESVTEQVLRANEEVTRLGSEMQVLTSKADLHGSNFSSFQEETLGVLKPMSSSVGSLSKYQSLIDSEMAGLTTQIHGLASKVESDGVVLTELQRDSASIFSSVKAGEESHALHTTNFNAMTSSVDKIYEAISGLRTQTISKVEETSTRIMASLDQYKSAMATASGSATERFAISEIKLDTIISSLEQHHKTLEKVSTLESICKLSDKISASHDVLTYDATNLADIKTIATETASASDFIKSTILAIASQIDTFDAEVQHDLISLKTLGENGKMVLQEIRGLVDPSKIEHPISLILDEVKSSQVMLEKTSSEHIEDVATLKKALEENSLDSKTAIMGEIAVLIEATNLVQDGCKFDEILRRLNLVTEFCEKDTVSTKSVLEYLDHIKNSGTSSQILDHLESLHSTQQEPKTYSLEKEILAGIESVQNGVLANKHLIKEAHASVQEFKADKTTSQTLAELLAIKEIVQENAGFMEEVYGGILALDNQVKASDDKALSAIQQVRSTVSTEISNTKETILTSVERSHGIIIAVDEYVKTSEEAINFTIQRLQSTISTDVSNAQQATAKSIDDMSEHLKVDVKAIGATLAASTTALESDIKDIDLVPITAAIDALQVKVKAIPWSTTTTIEEMSKHLKEDYKALKAMLSTETSIFREEIKTIDLTPTNAAIEALHTEVKAISESTSVVVSDMGKNLKVDVKDLGTMLSASTNVLRSSIESIDIVQTNALLESLATDTKVIAETTSWTAKDIRVIPDAIAVAESQISSDNAKTIQTLKALSNSVEAMGGVMKENAQTIKENTTMITEINEGVATTVFWLSI